MASQNSTTFPWFMWFKATKAFGVSLTDDATQRMLLRGKKRKV